MKAVLFTLVLANLVAGAWLLLGTPIDVVREPGRLDQQVDAARLRLLTEADVARKRDQARAQAAAVAPAVANATAPGAAPSAGSGQAATGTGTSAAAPPAPPPSAPPANAELPLASCIDIGTFASESATRKIRARLTAAGLGDHLASSTVDKVTRLRMTGVDAAGEAQVHVILRDFPKQDMGHCSEAPPAK